MTDDEKLKSGTFHCFTASTPAADALATYRARWHAEPAYQLIRNNMLWLGPVPGPAQSDMFAGRVDDLPIFSGTPPAGREQVFDPQPASRQERLF